MKRSICGPTTVLVKHGRLSLVTSPSTIQSGRIQVLTRGRQSVFTMTICRRLRQHEFRRRCRGFTPVGLKPSLGEAPTTAQDEPNRQRIHLTEPKRCLDEAGHRSALRQTDRSIFLQSIVTSRSTRIGSVDGGTYSCTRSADARPAIAIMQLTPYRRAAF